MLSFAPSSQTISSSAAVATPSLPELYFLSFLAALMAAQVKNITFIISALIMTLLLLFASCFIFSASAQSYGTATYYTPPYVPSACFGFEEQGGMIAAVSEGLWNNGAACGKTYQVTCLSGTNQGVPMPCRGSGTVTVTIVDLCPSPACRGTIDLSQEAFSSIADPNAGVINISFQQL